MTDDAGPTEETTGATEDDEPADPDGPTGDGSGPREAEGPADEDGEPGGSESASDRNRRWLIRILVLLAIGIPIAIEARTLIGLIEQALGGGDGDGGTTTVPGGVGVGDDLLPATPQTERVADAFVSTGGGRMFTLAVTVENAGDRPYRLRLGDLRTDGETVSRDFSTDPIPPGESTSVVARWSLPDDAMPREVRVEGETIEDGTVVDTVAEWVRLGGVAVR